MLLSHRGRLDKSCKFVVKTRRWFKSNKQLQFKKKPTENMYHYVCKRCNETFVSKANNAKFCSLKCSAISNNTGRIRRILKYCKSCEKLLKTNKNTYCSISCQQLLMKSQRTEEDLLKLSNKTLRNLLIEKHGAKCMKCGWCEINPVTGKVPVELNHIDGNSTNKNPSNLEIICPNCHSLTPTFRSLNKGNGRFKRRERYKEGKSY
jgi:hypothetical protein